MAASFVLIINPIAGTRRRPGRAADLHDMVSAMLTALGVHGEILITEGVGHAHDLAAGAASRGAETVMAWGGDGTVNEVASALAFTTTCLAIIPQGSGNGLARGLGIPMRAAAALAVAIGRDAIGIDVGELDGRRFVNAAGVGIDAAIAHRFAQDGRRRGLRRYAELTLSEVCAYRAAEYSVMADGVGFRTSPLLFTLANGPQFGNGAVIAPDARPDDGLLDLVIAEARHPLVAILQAPMLFLGGATRLPGVRTRQVSEVSISASGPIRYHVDGEAAVGGSTVLARVHPAVLRVKVPAAPQPTNR